MLRFKENVKENITIKKLFLATYIKELFSMVSPSSGFTSL